MKSKLTLKTLMMIGLSVVSLNSFAYADHNNHANNRSTDYRPVKVSQVGYETHHNQSGNRNQAGRHNGKDFSPHAAWKTGYVLPNQYRAKPYQVYRYNGVGLQRPGKNQQWFKIKGDYVLVNMVNHHIIRIINGR